MNVKKFIFKFIDHDNKKIVCYHVDTHCEHVMEWVHKEDPLKHAEWILKEVGWKHKLKKKVEEAIQGLKPELKEYELCKIKKMGDSEIVNMSFGQQATEKVLRKVYSMGKCVMKFSKGTHPTHWTDVFNYSKENHFHAFNVTKDGDQVQLTQLGFFDIPAVAGSEASDVITSTEQKPQTGLTQEGGYAKYRKYKTKYMAKKNGLF